MMMPTVRGRSRPGSHLAHWQKGSGSPAFWGMESGKLTLGVDTYDVGVMVGN